MSCADFCAFELVIATVEASWLGNGHLLISRVAALVVKHVPLGAEGLTAVMLRASKRTLVSVDAHVNIEVLLLAESFAAGGIGALKRLSAQVQVQVGIQSGLAAKDLIAAGMGTGVAWVLAFFIVTLTAVFLAFLVAWQCR